MFNKEEDFEENAKKIEAMNDSMKCKIYYF